MPDFSGVKDMAKHGWHPDKGQTSFRGQVGAVFGRNKEQQHANHNATPLSQLRDPSTFAPPPKHVATHGGTPSPLSPSTSADHHYGQQEGAPEEPAPPPRPYRVDTTGLSTADLPPPPARRDGTDGRSPLPPPDSTAKPGPPSLPPRLPPRSNTGSPITPTSPVRPPPLESSSTNSGVHLNQGAMARLGAAGVSVPALGIGRPSMPALPPRPSSRSPPPPPRPGVASPPPAGNSTMRELQQRFARLSTGSGSGSSSPAAAPNHGTTWAQKQAALKTASDFRKDPSSVSLADARSAAFTANNFRQRHGEQVAAGARMANNLNQKYGISDRLSQRMNEGAGETARNSGPSAISGDLNGLAAKKKPPPPPPPKKKPHVAAPAASSSGGDDIPPPIPMSTRPTF